MSAKVLHGDCVEAMAAMDEASVDAVVCDPPAGIAFMGKDWDSDKGGRDAWIAWLTEVMGEALRVCKPGAHALVWALPRTSHWTATALEDAGWEVRDRIAHHFGSGFPKSLDVSKAIDKAAGAEREVVGEEPDRWTQKGGVLNFATDRPQESVPVTGAPATPDAAQWDGWGTALKPATEDWWLCRKPLIGTVSANVLAHGTGAINVDGCRVGTEDDLNGGAYSGDKRQRDEYTSTDTVPGAEPLSRLNRGIGEFETPAGRWPANVVLDQEAAGELDAQTAHLKEGVSVNRNRDGSDHSGNAIYGARNADTRDVGYGDSGGASRFFYCAKSSRTERNAGLESFPTTRSADEGYGSIQQPKLDRAAPRESWEPHKTANHHPTVKPINLMRWLVRLVTPPGGVVLDPFCGSGSTGCAAVLEGFDFIGCEREAEYVAIAEARIAFWAQHPDREPAETLKLLAKSEAARDDSQSTLELAA